MKLTVLTDNTVLQSKNLLGEHGLSFYIEDEDKKILFDTGYSDVFLKNACKMGIDLLELDFIVLSHGHYDHTWGLSHYLSFYSSSKKLGRKPKKPVIVTHPDTFLPKFDEKAGEIGCLISKDTLLKNFDVITTKEPFKITKNLLFLGEIPRNNDFEGKEKLGKVKKNNDFEDDVITEDSALVFSSEEGAIVITGCSHSGICNIIDYAIQVSSKNNILDVIGGFHLVNPTEERLVKTANYLKKLGLKGIHACHCTDFGSKIALSTYLKLETTGVGLVIKYNERKADL